MFLSELKIWNFRKYGIKGERIEDAKPGLLVKFYKGLNLLVGENDSGKTTIIDAIKHILYTQSYEFLRIDEIDFYKPQDGPRTDELKIECIFRGFETYEASNFLEWIGFEEYGKKQEYVLKVRLTARNRNNRIVTEIKAGHDETGVQLDGAARELLRVTYLKPLRDAESELTPGRRSRFAQILKSHEIFQKTKGDDEKHTLEKYIIDANQKIKNFFKKDKIIENKDKKDTSSVDSGAKPIMDELNQYLEEFFPEGNIPEAFVNISGSELGEILNRLSLNLEENKSGLGSLNLLFIAAELILLQREKHTGLKMALIEEIEAHLHPQAQLRLIDFLQKEENKGQFILSTHSTTLASSIRLKHLIICKEENIFPMGYGNTKLSEGDYNFLERFLDATKANLFFARGVILVEGDTENLLIPTIAEILERPLYRYGVSVVNVRGKAFLRYSKIFLRKNQKEPQMDIPVSIISDLDVRPKEYYEDKNEQLPNNISELKKSKKNSMRKQYKTGTIEVFVSPNWTLEYEIAFSGLKSEFYSAVLIANKIKNNDDYSFNGEIPKEIEDAVNKYFTDHESNSLEQIAYDIYKPLLKSRASKTVTAQIFAHIIKNNKKDIKAIIESDPYWEYIREAIYHVTKKPDKVE